MTINNKIFKKDINKVSKIKLLALPLTLLALNSAQAGDFPTFAVDDLYMNHVDSSVPGNNLIVNPTFGIINCAEYEAEVLAASVECLDGKTWGWDNIVQSGGGSLDANYEPPNAVVDVSRRGALNKDLTLTLSQSVDVTDVNDVYVDTWLFVNLANGTDGGIATVNLVLDGGVKVEILTTPSVQLEHPIEKWVHTFDTPYTGSINLEVINTGANKILLDHVFLSTDQHTLAPSDVDGDGTPDEFDAFVDNSAADTDADLDGLADFFIDVLCKEGGVVEGADLAECNGLTLDTDDDNDGDSDVDEISAGTDPLNADSNAADFDADGWHNVDSGDIAANDNFPTLAYVHQAALTNAVVAYAVDAETATVVDTGTSTTTTEWEWSTSVKGGVVEYQVVDTTDLNGEATKAFRLAIVDSGTKAGKNVQLRTSLISTVNQNVSILRLAGWVKATGPEVNDTASSVQVKIQSNHNVDDGKAASVVNKAWTFTDGSADRDIYNSTENNGWSYFEQDFDIGANVVDSKIHLMLKTDVAGVEVLFDNLELNFINSGDFDEDGIIDAIDNDDDNDGIKDGLDASPLGEGAGDSDGDGILDGYDDDLDADGIADAFDDALPSVIIEDTALVYENDLVTIPVEALASNVEDTTLAYSWTMNGDAMASTSSKLNINVVNSSGATLTFEVTVSAGFVSNSKSWTVTTNTMPTVEIVADKRDSGVLYTATKGDVDGDAMNIAWYVNDVKVTDTDSYFLNYDTFNEGTLASVNVYAMVTDVNRPEHTGTSNIDSIFIPLKETLDQQPNGGSTQIGMLAMLLLGLTRRITAKTK